MHGIYIYISGHLSIWRIPWIFCVIYVLARRGTCSHIGLTCVLERKRGEAACGYANNINHCLSHSNKKVQLFLILVSSWTLASPLSTDQNILQTWAIYCRHSHSCKLQNCSSKIKTIRGENEPGLTKIPNINTEMQQKQWRYYESWKQQKISLAIMWRDLWNEWKKWSLDYSKRTQKQ